MSCRAYQVLGLFLLLSTGGWATSAPQPLTLREAIREALGKSPETAIAQANTAGLQSAAALARTQLLPQINFTEDISRGDDPVYAFGTRLRQQRFTSNDFALDALNRPNPIGNYATRVSGSWMAFDSLRSQREIRSADLSAKSSSSGADAVEQQIVFRVIEAYQSALYAQRKIEVAKFEEETAETLLGSADDHVKAGLAVESDRMSAQVNVAARKQDLIAAQGEMELAWAKLREAMGVENLPAAELKAIEPHSFSEMTLDDEMASAVKNRPDVMAASLAQAAQSAAVDAARSNFGPRVSAYGNWEQDRRSFAGSGGNNWVAGVQVSLDLLPVGKRAELARQTAARHKTEAQAAALRLHVRLEVSQAHIHRQTSLLSLETAQAAMNQSAESLRILKNRYGAGLATLTDLLRGEDAERESQANYWRAVYGNAMAYAELLFATGMLTPDRAEELQ